MSWLCENIQQNLTRIDRVLAALASDAKDEPKIDAGEPWVERLIERRRELQSTLADIERQIDTIRC